MVKYKKKIHDKTLLAAKKVFVCLFFILFIIIVFFLFLKLFSLSKKNLEQEIILLQKNNNVVLKERDEMDAKIEIFNKYNVFWSSMTQEQKKFMIPSNIEAIKTQIETSASNNNLINFDIKITEPKKMDGLFAKKYFLTYNSEISISFYALTDLHVYSFLDELRKYLSIHYYPIFQKIEIKRVKKIDDKFLETLKNNGIEFSISGVVNINLFALEIIK
jgi:hypothetical protein